jgi:hypothetical protein
LAVSAQSVCSLWLQLYVSHDVTPLPLAALLDVIKRVRGAAQKNAAIAGSHVMPRCLWLAVFDVRLAARDNS